MLRDSTACFQHHDVELSSKLDVLQHQAAKDMSTLEVCREDVSTQVALTQTTVQSYLYEELREDLPTGTYPFIGLLALMLFLFTLESQCYSIC